MKLLGIDIGFGFTKATDGKNNVIFKSIFGDAEEYQFFANFGDNSPVNHIHVSFNGKSYFIGELAEQQSSVLNFTLDQENLVTDFVRLLALTVAGMFMKDDDISSEPINIVSGLPIGYFKQNHERFNEILTGQHSITFHSYNGKKITKEININQVHMIPQPLGTALNLLMDDNGQIINQELANQKIGVVDIGFRTTDFTIVDHLRYIDRGSRTLDKGISNGFSILANKLREKCGVNVELYRLYEAAENGLIKMRGRGYNFIKMRDQIYSQLVRSITSDIDRLWTDDWDIDTIVLTGGGCRELAQYLQPLINGHITPIDPDIDPRLNNVHGYFKYGKHIWGDSPSELGQVEEVAKPKKKSKAEKKDSDQTDEKEELEN